MSIGRLLPPGSARRLAAVSAAAALALLLGTRLLPSPGKGGAGTPYAILFQGAIAGSLNALTAIGLVLVYRASRIINFAQAALGAAGAIFCYDFVVALHLPYGLAFVAGVVIAAAVGVFSELFFRRFFDAPRLVLTIGTVGLAGLLTLIPGIVATLPLWGENLSLLERAGLRAIRPFPRITVRWFPVTLRFSHFLALGMVVVCLAGVGAFLRFTRLGVAVRASSENAERAEMLGINAKMVSTVVWGLAGALAGVGVILSATNSTFALAGQVAPDLLIVPLAAAVLARMRSLVGAAAAALWLTTFGEALSWSYPKDADSISSVLYLGVIALGFLAQRRELLRLEEASAWQATEEVRPVPRELLSVPGVRAWRSGVLVLVGLAVLAFPWVMPAGQTHLGTLAAITAIAILSIVILTGWAGQVSLGQWAFVAVGAVTAGALSSRLHVPFWFAVPAAGVITAALAVLLGLPALRIRGLFLAATTFAFAFTVHRVLFNEKWFGWLLPKAVERPKLLFLDFEDERSLYYLALAFLALTVLGVVNLRRTRVGRIILALRENPADLTALGINVVRMRLVAFGLAGFAAGIAGGLFAHSEGGTSQQSFQPVASLNLFVFSVIGGLGSVTGALLGAAFQSLQALFPSDPILGFFVNASVGLLVILYLAPGGLASVLYAVRDSILRIVAQRRGILVPSLFADVDPEAFRRRLILLAEPQHGSALAVLGTRRYRLDSVLYKVEPSHAARARAADDRAALAGAVEAFAAAPASPPEAPEEPVDGPAAS